ncbi:rhomboid-like protein [Antrihabitans cavernicola]|uniref:Rhomboid family intramembrane serine protease n=1 Tax=Antrihabitans cavernicola TaxID=2495913 RepID=A0A5A7SA25_9NOCA|nr:rhomboid-like protein [Spelaeibacter cavernicola]KAA0021687.1 hypothetical protein FOY51_17520 [Spelaeibacter cavernicola]
MIDTVSKIGSRAFAMMRRTPVALGYLIALASVSVFVATLGSGARTHLISRASTNLHNLTDGRLSVLFSSAFLSDGGPDWIVYPLLAGVLIAAEVLAGRRRLIGVFAVGHLGATLIVAAGLLVAVRSGWISSAVMTDPDVGVSYGAAAVLGAMTGALPVRWRATWSVAMVVGAVSGVIFGQTFTNVGHLIALSIGLVIAMSIPHRSPLKPIGIGTIAMLAVAVVFALAIFGGDVQPGWATPVLAVTAAATVATATRVTVRAADWTAGTAAFARVSA